MSECLARPPSCAGGVFSADWRQRTTVRDADSPDSVPDGAHATTHSMAWRGVVEVQKPMARMPVADRRPKRRQRRQEAPEPPSTCWTARPRTYL